MAKVANLPAASGGVITLDRAVPAGQIVFVWGIVDFLTTEQIVFGQQASPFEPIDTRGNIWTQPRHGLSWAVIEAGKELQVGDTIQSSGGANGFFRNVGGAIWKEITQVANPSDESITATYPTSGGLTFQTGSGNQTGNVANPGATSAPWSLTNNAGLPPAYIFVTAWAGNCDYILGVTPPPAPAAPEVSIPGTVEFTGAGSGSAGDPGGGGGASLCSITQTLKVGWFRTTADLPREVAGSFTGLLSGSSAFGTPEHGFFIQFWVFSDDAEPGSGLANLATLHSYYNRAWIEDAELKVGRSRWIEPPFDVEATLPAGDAPAHPRLYEDFVNERLWCLWDEDDTVLRSSSDDDAETWSEPVPLFENASFPYAVVDPVSASVLVAAYSDGKIIGRLQTPGEATPGDQFTFQADGADLAVSEDSFSIVWHADPSSRLILVARKEGESDVTEWRSFDDGRTWTEVT